MNLAITNALVLTLDENRKGLGIVDDGAVGVTRGEIPFVGPTAEFDAASADRVIDAADAAVVPGLVDAHVHIPSRCFAGAHRTCPRSSGWTAGSAPSNAT